jgi:hypothetical protein
MATVTGIPLAARVDSLEPQAWMSRVSSEQAVGFAETSHPVGVERKRASSAMLVERLVGQPGSR